MYAKNGWWRPFFCLFTKRAFYDVRMLGYYCVSLSLSFSFSHLICWLTMWMDILKDADGVFLCCCLLSEADQPSDYGKIWLVPMRQQKTHFQLERFCNLHTNITFFCSLFLADLSSGIEQDVTVRLIGTYGRVCWTVTACWAPSGRVHCEFETFVNLK